MKWSIRLTVLVLVLFFSATGSAFAEDAAGYNIVDLGDPSGCGMSVYDINDVGTVVGSIFVPTGATCGDGGYYQAYWLPAGYDLNELVYLAETNSIAQAINNQGAIAGDFNVNSRPHAFYWADGALTDLGTLGGIYSHALDLNDSGQVVGWATVAVTNYPHAFIWDEQNGLVDLHQAPWLASRAYGINNAGQIVGQATLPDGSGYHAVMWDTDGAMHDLGTLGGKWSEAYAINNHGQIVGQAMIAGDFMHAFLWQDGAMQDLGTFGGAYSFAYDINDSGQIAGNARTAQNYGHAFLWQDGVLNDLNVFGPNSGANGINEGGVLAGSTQLAPNVRTNGAVWLPPNQAPVVQTAAVTIDEGDLFNIQLTFSDPDSTAWTAVVDYGDGAGPQPLSLNADQSFTLTAAYPADDGEYSIAVRITDNQGAEGTGVTSVTVRNQAPTVQLENLVNGATTVLVGQAVSLAATFTDAGLLDTHTATVAWGDGVYGTTYSATSPLYSGHSYRNAGVFQVTVSVSDDDGGVDTVTALLAVVEANGAIIEASADLADLLQNPDIEPAAQAALLSAQENLLGAADGAANNGALARLEAGDLIAALNSLQQALEDLEAAAAADPALDVSALANLLAETAHKIARDAIELARPNVNTDDEQLKLDQAITLAESGAQHILTGAYAEAISAFRQAVGRTLDIH